MKVNNSSSKSRQKDEFKFKKQFYLVGTQFHAQKKKRIKGICLKFLLLKILMII